MTMRRMTSPATRNIPVSVRRASVDDADVIAGIHVRAWQEAYRHLLPHSTLDTLDPADRVDRWRRIVSGDDEETWVAELEGTVVAWATTSARDGSTYPRDREVNGIYALASAHGSGVGQALLDALVGDAPAFLWVASNNPRAHAFYRRNGFGPDGAVDEYAMLGTLVAIERWTR